MIPLRKDLFVLKMRKMKVEISECLKNDDVEQFVRLIHLNK